MKRNFNLALASLLCLSFIFAAQSVKASDWLYGYAPNAPQTGSSEWTAPKYWPESGDKIIGLRIGNYSYHPHCVHDFANLIHNAQDSRVLLVVVDQHTGNPYFLRTILRPFGSSQRLGLTMYGIGSSIYVDHCSGGSPITRCQWYVGSGWPLSQNSNDYDGFEWGVCCKPNGF